MDKNYEYLLEIDITPSAAATYKELMDGIDNLDQSLNEVLFQSSFLADEGWGSSEVTGGQFTMTLTGKRIVGNEAQDYICSTAVMFGFGDARKTNIRITEPGGRQLIVPVTLAKIQPGSGDAQQPSDFSVEIHGNGKPTLAEDGAVIGQLTIVSLAGGDAGKTQLYVNPAITGETYSYKYKTAASVSVPAYDTVCTTGWTAWDGSAEIVAASDDEIVIIEILTADNKAKKAGKQTVTSND
jgi:hypothetical protein